MQLAGMEPLDEDAEVIRMMLLRWPRHNDVKYGRWRERDMRGQ
jgi:hypothetical protein